MSRSLTAGDHAVADAETLRKASLKRALMAIVALTALTASLWLVEGSETAAPPAPSAAPVPAAPPAVEPAAAPAAPVTTEAAPVVAEQAAPAEAGQARTGETQSAPLATAPDGAMATPEAPPPGWTASAVPAAPATPPARVQAADAPAAATAASAVAPAETPEASPRADAPRLHAGPPPGPGYLIQLGVFLDTANAESMRRELERKGYPAHLQARVVLGPYPDRESAIAAQEKVRRERKLDGMILAPRK